MLLTILVSDAPGRRSVYCVSLLLDGEFQPRSALPLFTDLDVCERFQRGRADAVTASPQKIETHQQLIEELDQRQREGVTFVAYDPILADTPHGWRSMFYLELDLVRHTAKNFMKRIQDQRIIEGLRNDRQA